MSTLQQRTNLHNQIWQAMNKARGSIDGWDFKQYTLGSIFYRFLSENFASYMEGGDGSGTYAQLTDYEFSSAEIEDAVNSKGFFIHPKDLFVNVHAAAAQNQNLNIDLANIFQKIEQSAIGYSSEGAIRGLFADFDTASNRLGATVAQRNHVLLGVLNAVAGLDFGTFEDASIDLFGDAYEFLISNYAANAGKSGGEYFTPQSVSSLIARLATQGQETINAVYDPAAGSGSLLLQATKHIDPSKIEYGFYGQEINPTTYNLARMNMFLHNVNYDKFHIAHGNTLTDPYFLTHDKFDAIVSNPPYSIQWVGKSNVTLINDVRFAPAGVLAPESKADMAFVMHCLHYLSAKGRAAIVCFPGVFYRGGAEQKIRKYLIDNNYVESIIQLPPNLFFGTSIATTILVLSKHKADTKTQFIDASALFKKDTNNNVLEDAHSDAIVNAFVSKSNVDYFARSVELAEIAANNYNLAVSSYVTAEDTREVIDIGKLNAEVADTVLKVSQLRTDIDAIIEEINNG